MPMQMALGEHFKALGIRDISSVSSTSGKSWSANSQNLDILWWRTYSPPVWLLNAELDGPITKDLMGRPAAQVREMLAERTRRCGDEVWLVTPDANDEYVPWQGWVGSWNGSSDQAVCGEDGEARVGAGGNTLKDVRWWKVHTERNHIGLDDLDFAEDGVMGTLDRVIGRRGLTAWRLRNCRC